MTGVCTVVQRLLNQVPINNIIPLRNGNLTLRERGFVWVVEAAVVLVGVWGVWVGPGLVWMVCVVLATTLLWGGRLLAAGHQSSIAVSRCW